VSQANARDALVSALNFHFYFEDRRSAVAPKIVELPASLATKVLLLNELVRQNVRPAELARRLGTTPQEVNRRPTCIMQRASMASERLSTRSASGSTSAPPDSAETEH
jgi:hypothetical protein